jgi:hypothetical protein
MSANNANIIAVMGASGSGKSSFIKWTLLKPAAVRRRLLIWDFKREYDAWGESITSPLALVRAVRGRKTFQLCYQPPMDEKDRAKDFDLFCKVAYSLGNTTLLAEELAFVTSPSWAPPAWKMMTCTGRHEGMTVIGASQRPAQIDKDFLGNCTLIHAGRLASRDAKAVAMEMDVTPQEIVNLPKFHYLERDRDTGELRQGITRIPASVTG